MSHRIHALLLALLGLSFFAQAEAGPSPRDVATRGLGALIDAQKLAGVAVGLYQAGAVEVFGLGETERGTGQVPGGDTLFEIGSITKTYTGTLLALLAQEGKLKESDPLQDYLPATVHAPAFEGTPILLGQLSSHTSGLPRLPDDLPGKDAADPYAGYDEAKLYAFLNAHSLRRKPGTEYEYSNLAAGLLGHLLAGVAGVGYESLVTQRILAPLAMKDTAITLSPGQQERFAQGYRPGGIFAKLHAQGPWDLAVLAGAGALRSSVNDQLKWIGACLGNAPPTLTAALQSAMTSRFDLPGGGQVGLGWHRAPIVGDATMVWHNGETGGYHAFLGFVPAWNAGIVVLGNSACNFDKEAIDALAAMRPGQS